MNRILWVTIILVSCGLLSTPATASGDRSTQVYQGVGLFSNAQYVNWLAMSQNNSLFQVKMWYDFQTESFSSYKGKAKSWNPPYALWWQTDYWKYYLEASSCLGPSGPLGHRGPLGSYGPIGNNTWNPAVDPFNPSSWTAAYWAWFKSIAGWAFDSDVSLGEDGPLGRNGPLVTSQIYDSMYHLNELFGANDFPINLDITGVWGALGPLSVLGPLGMLGALGPLGPHLYNSSGDGQYRDGTGKIVRTLPVVYDKKAAISRVYDLFEVYPAATAASLGAKNDASFAVDGIVNGVHDIKQRFRFTSTRNQSITAAAIPAGENFTDLDIYVYKVTAKGAGVALEIIRSSTPASYSPMKGLIDWSIWHANAGDVLEVMVRSASPSASRYRLMVVGTGFKQGAAGHEVDVDLFNHMNIVGPHQDSYCRFMPKACTD